MSTLQGKTALITGGNSGIGYATALEFISKGARVVITGRNAAAVKEAADKLGHGTIGLVADQGNLAHIDQLAADVKERVGHLDVLFVNAGIATFAPITLATEEHYDSIMDINVKGVFFTVQKLLPLLRDGGSIILNASVMAQMGSPGSAVYSASKAALQSFVRVLASELSERAIRINTLSPGPIETPIYGKLGMSDEQQAGMKSSVAGKVLLKRFGEAHEIAKAAVFLASPESSYVNGTDLLVDGGAAVRQ
ncbi:SDR family oxidoreductase [Nostoc sp. NIES-2111]